ncbi:MAG: diacylglycerol kinase family protein [Planctomycetaceae bacterium]|nr:NAD(+)/NADH kinase [Planctomycetaceae bacterium]
MQHKPVHLVINPHSGYGGRKLLVNNLRLAMRAAGIPLVEHRTTGPHDATDYVRKVVDDADSILVWGGDGTVNEVATALAGTDVPMLVCPAGTENLLANELGMSADAEAILNIYRARMIVSCDVGVVNDRNFLLIIGVGFDGEVVRRVSQARTGHISHLSYFWPIWRTFWEHDFPRLRITADGEQIFDDYGLAFIGNISRYAVGLRICRNAHFDDGLLDLVVFSCHEQTALLLHAAWTMLRRHPLKGNALYRQFRKLHIETDRRVLSQVDGDVGPDSPLDISVGTDQVKLIVPAPGRRTIWPWKGGHVV